MATPDLVGVRALASLAVNTMVTAWVVAAVVALIGVAALRHLWLAFDRPAERVGRATQAATLSVAVVGLTFIASQIPTP